MGTAVPKVEGKLTHKALGEILRKLEGHRSAAYLLVSDGLAEKCLYFSVGAIRLTSMGKRRAVRLEDALGAHPRVGEENLHRARIRQQETGEPFEEILADKFSLGDVVRECSTAIVRDEVLDLLLWDGAYFEYAEANPPPKIFDPRLEAVKLSFGVAKLLKEVVESIPKAQKVMARVPGGKARLGRGPAWGYGAPADAEKPVCIAIAQAIPEGGAAFDDVVVHARSRGFDALRVADALDKMFEAKTVEPPKKGEKVQLPKEQEVELAKQEVQEIEGALDVIINELVARQRLAQGYLAMGDQPRAVFNLKKVGDELLQRNKGEEAIDAFRQIVKIVPHEFGVREKIAYLYEKMRKVPEAIGEGLDLANMYKKFGLFNRAKNIFRRVIHLEPGNIDHRRQLIELLVKLKDNQEAVAEYENLAEIFHQKQQEEELLAVYQSILALDPNHGAAKQKTKAIIQRRPGFWVPYVAVAFGFIILGIASLWVASEYRAIHAYEEARRDAFERADRGDYAGARDAVESFLRIHDGSRVAPKAIGLKQQLAMLEEERRERYAREEYERARQLETGGRVMQARDVYSRLLASARGTKWESNASLRIKEIDALSEQAERELTTIRRLESDRSFREALEKARDLVRRLPWTDAAQRLEVKLDIVTSPPGASVTVDGRPVAGRTPCLIQQRAIEPFMLTITMQGFAPEQRKVDIRDDVSYPYTVELNRALRWKATLLGPVDAPPLVERDGVFVAGRDQRLYSLDAEGRVRWSRSLGLFADATSRPVRVGTRIVAGDRTGVVTAVDAATGAVAWRARVRGPAMPVAATADGAVVVADEEGALVAFEGATGKERWRMRIAGGICAMPTPDNGTIVVPSGEAVLVLVDAKTGAEKARLQTGARPTAPVGVSGMGYVVAVEGEQVRFIGRDGKPLWPAPVKVGGEIVAAPLVAGGAAFVCAGKNLIALEMQDGSKRWSREYAAAIRAAPAFRANRLYVATGDGAMHALTAETGNPRWSYRTQGEIVAQPVPEADTVYVASTDFGVYAIRDN